jgi:hypothetical protein
MQPSMLDRCENCKPLAQPQHPSAGKPFRADLFAVGPALQLELDELNARQQAASCDALRAAVPLEIFQPRGLQEDALVKTLS